MSSILRVSYLNYVSRQMKQSLGASTTTNVVTRKYLSTDTVTKNTLTTDAKDSNTNTAIDNELVNRLKSNFNDDIAAGNVVPVFKKALLYGNKIAIKDKVAEYSYSQLYNGAKKLSVEITNLCGSKSNKKIAFLCSNTAIYTMVQWACWFSGQIAVPLSPQHPPNMLDYYIKDSESSILITIPEYANVLSTLADSRPLIVIDHSYIPSSSEVAALATERDLLADTIENSFYKSANAMILYTSGSTGKPKGTVLSHRNIDAQVSSLASAWEMSEKDSLLHVLPLNHVHGSVNALLCPLSVGAKLTMLPQFNSSTVWSTLLNVNMPSKEKITVFMAVPTIYTMLISEYDKVFSKNSRMVDYVRAQCEKLIRLMVSGSAPLPNTVFKRWHEITGHKLLERYGMTEIGMALSNPYHMDKVRDRTPGSVGVPLPGTEVRLLKGSEIVAQVKGEANKGYWSTTELPVYQNKVVEPAVSGELYIKSPSIFVEYLNRPKDTAECLSADGWFKTGDEAKYENGIFSILGRTSVDIIKMGGYKISALEIETQLMSMPLIKDVCVVGVPDDTWGQRIAALIVGTVEDEKVAVQQIKEFCAERIPSYQVPSIFKFVKEIPRNAMGKINKKSILKDVFTESAPVNVSDAPKDTK